MLERLQVRGGRRARVGLFEVGFPCVEEREPVAGGLVAKVVDAAAVGVDCGDVGEQPLRQEPPGDGEVLIV